MAASRLMMQQLSRLGSSFSGRALLPSMSVYNYKKFRNAIAFCCLLQASSFTVAPARPVARACLVGLSALTERQMQFWEDVEEGLDDVEEVYASKGQDIDRIRMFGKR